MAFCDLSHTCHKQVTNVSPACFVILLWGIFISPLIDILYCNFKVCISVCIYFSIVFISTSSYVFQVKFINVMISALNSLLEWQRNYRLLSEMYVHRSCGPVVHTQLLVVSTLTTSDIVTRLLHQVCEKYKTKCMTDLL